MSEQRLLAILIIATALVMAPAGWLLLPVLGATDAHRCGLEFVLGLAIVASLAGIAWDAWRGET